MPGEPTSYTDIGGGGDLKPHGEDYFNRITNVHWPKKRSVTSESIFAMGDLGSNVCYVGGAKVDDASGTITPADVVPLGTLDFDDGAIYGSSCHIFRTGVSGAGDRPVFILCGYKNTPGPGDNGIIVTSNDGKNWTTVYTIFRTYDDTHRGDAWVFAVVWDSNAFYAGAHKWVQTFKERDDGAAYLSEQKEFDILLRSTDGMSWSEVGSQDFVIYSSPDGYGAGTNHGDPPWGENGLLASHCRNGIPDGFSYYFSDLDTSTEIYIRPGTLPTANYNYGDISATDPSDSVLIDIKIGGETPISRSTSPGFPVCGVAYSGGVIVAVGGTEVISVDRKGPSKFAISYNRGESWVAGSYSGVPPVNTVCGKP